MTQSSMQLTDWLDDLSVRFIVNLPLEELESMERICFQIEEAQWFYEDFVRPLDPKLPSLNLRQFSMKIFQHCPLFSGHGEELHAQAFSEFLAYKTRVPVRGAILLNEAMDQVILVKGWKKGANWSFPRGKINKDEEDLDCAIREVYEETGYDVNAAGLIADRHNVKSIEVTMREQHMKLFVFAGISMNTHFEPRTRKEIGAIQWYKLSDLPTLKRAKNQQDTGNTGSMNANKFYMVAPFVRPLKGIISQLKRERAHTTSAPAVPGPLNDMSSALPEQVMDSGVPMQAHDMNRLMAQLRQSSQASREANYPEVSDLQDAQRAAALRENKANAMLSILRSGQPPQAPYNVNHPPPQTPLDQMIGHPTQAPPSPHSHPIRAPRNANLPAPPMFEVSPEQISQQYVPHTMRQQPLGRPPQMQQSVHRQQNLLPTVLRESSQPYPPPVAAALYHSTGDPSFAQSPQPLVGQHTTSVPPASKLPPPKLNAHSSTLLSLFKSGQQLSINTLPTSASLAPAHEPIRPELSPPSVATIQRGQHTPIVNVSSPAMLSSTPALVSPASGAHPNDPKKAAHQETLLSLFRQPNPSPSLAPPYPPAELSAQGSPTHSRMSSDYYMKREKSAARAGNAEMWSPRGLELATSDGRVSATVSGPLNVPQFEKILQRPAGLRGQAIRRANQDAQPAQPPQQIKILPRPSTTTMPTQVATAREAASPPKKRSPKDKPTSSSKDLPFQPKILKRPETARQQAEQHSPRSHPSGEEMLPPQQPMPSAEVVAPILSQATPIIDRRTSQTEDQKAALLSLFGKMSSTAVASGSSPAPPPPPAHGRPGSIVSPLSEKPPVGSTLPSPLGLGKSRMPSIPGDRALPKRTKSSETTHSVTSPVDKKFLLGYLDSVASQGRS